jgi:hypothetical protein
LILEKEYSIFLKSLKHMSKIEELKKQNPNYVIDVVTIINGLFGKTKYTEMVINLVKNEFANEKNRNNDIINELVGEFELNREELNSYSGEEVYNIFKVINDFIGHNNFKTVKKFIELNERKLIVNNDLTSFKRFDELDLQMSLAQLKLIDKEMEKQVIKLHETNEWLVIKPMSFLSSKKYGANTKWCTTNEDNPEYYLRYSRRGILIYCMNKITGDKVAAFKSLDTSYDKETSFWNMVDNRIDSIDSNLPNEVMDVIRYEFNNTTKSNWDILPDDEKNRQVLWLENEYMSKKSSLGNESVEQSRDYELAVPMIGEVADVAPRQARIVPIGLARFDDIPTQAG